MSSKIIFVLLLIGLVACAPVSSPTPSIPTPAAIWRVQVDPEVDYLKPLFNLCAQQNPEVGILLVEDPSGDHTTVDLAFRWGTPENIQGYAVILGKDPLAFIVHPINPLVSLSKEDLRNIYQNNLREWKQLDSVASFPEQIEVWRYLPERAIQKMFESLLDIPELHNPFAMLSPDPEAMRQAVSQNPAAVGFLPAHWLDASVKSFSLRDVPPESLNQPILVVSAHEPDKLQQEWLLCIQDVLERTTPQ